ncbi:MAG: peptidoglycan DD-metalloendopeptidase family protein [Phormidesmis sp. RL_2_1]|nr:peptidoglycan DD-metalloendopeptidase family protein [Phormidesmis sp. RL_2_1]
MPAAMIDAPPLTPSARTVSAWSEAVPAPQPVAPQAIAPPAAPPAVAATQQPSASNTSRVLPTVTLAAPPRFSAVKTPDAKNVSVGQRSSPLAGLMGAGAIAVPMSDYVGSPVAMASEASISQNAPAASTSARDLARDLAMENGAGSEATAPAAVPDISPTPASVAPPAVKPIVEAAPVEATEAAPIAEPPASVRPTAIVPAKLPEGANVPDEYNSVFVDPTDYSVGATATPNVVVSEQSTGCQFTVGANQAVPNGACAAGRTASPAPSQPARGSSASPSAAATASAPAVNVGPVSFSAAGIRFSGATTAAGRDYLNRTIRPLVNLQAAQQFIFPLSIPSPITSLFGFRIHPISGNHSFHAGTDIGAAQGTPVLAAHDGVVTSADYAGGYGLMVVLEHDLPETKLQTRYAHLSEIFVQPGSAVNKGDVVGLVGSTGNSTGPHLHFEMLQATVNGWVHVNPDGVVQNALANLVKALNDPMSVASFNLADLNLGLRRVNAGSNLSQPSSVELPVLPGQNGVPFRPAQPNAS